MEQEIRKNNGLGCLVVFGIIIGLIVGVLFAPKSGVETRKNLKKKAKKVIDNLEEEGEKIAKEKHLDGLLYNEEKGKKKSK